MTRTFLALAILLLTSTAMATTTAPVKLAEDPDSYEHKMGVVYTKLSSLAYNSITQGVPDSKLLFEIKRNTPSCFEDSSDLQCTTKIECNKDTEHDLLVCPLSQFNENLKETQFLLKDSSDEFYIQVVLTYPRIITHNTIREIIERSPIMTLGSLPNG